MLGILGGMGPLATVDFMTKIITLTKASCDQAHIPMLVHNVPQIPDRSSSIIGSGKSPLPELIKGVKTLEKAGAQCITIPCNTAHFWFEALQQKTKIPMLNIISSVIAALDRSQAKRVGLMATNATVAAGIYQKRLQKAGFDCLTPSTSSQNLLMQAIYKIKAGNIKEGREEMEAVYQELINAGADKIILGCTEIPIGLEQILLQQDEHCIDATQELAKACIEWYQNTQPLAA